MRMNLAFVSAAVVALALALAYFSLAVVSQTQQALILRFGALDRVVKEPGLTPIIPFVQSVRYFDNRILSSLEMADPVGVITSDKKRIDVDAFARYRISDPVKYYQSASSEEAVQQQLSTLMNSSLRRVLGRQNLGALLSAEREHLMREIRDEMQANAGDVGIEVVDVRIRRADLPTDNQTAVILRMQAERKQEAEGYRAQGDEDALRITADADRQVTVIRADATQKSDILRGQGEAERIQRALALVQGHIEIRSARIDIVLRAGKQEDVAEVLGQRERVNRVVLRGAASLPA